MTSLSSRGEKRSWELEVESLVRCLPIPTLLFDLAGVCLVASENWDVPADHQPLVGRSLNEVFGQTAIIIQDQWSKILAGEERTFLMRLQCNNDGFEQYSVRLKPWIDARSHQVVGVIASRIDSTKSTSAEAEKIAFEKKFSSIQQLHYQLVAILSPEGRLIEVNDPPLQLIQATREEVQGQLFWETPWFRDLPEERSRWPYRLQEALAAEAPIISRDYFQDAAGNVRIAETSLTAVKDETGRLSYFIIQAIDLTSRGVVENQSQIVDSNYERILRHLRVAVVVMDRAGYVTYVNQACVEIVGRVPVLFVDRWCICHKAFSVNGNPLSIEENPVYRAIRDGKCTGGYDLIIERPDGSRVFVTCFAQPLFDETGAIVGAVNTVVDITDQKETERLLRQSEERLAAAVDAGQLGIWEWDSSIRRNYWNSREYQLLGLPVGDGHPDSSVYYERIIDDSKTQMAVDFEKALSQGASHFSREIKIERADTGEPRWLAGFARIYYGSGGSYKVVGVNYDITDQKLLEEELRNVAQQLAEANRRKDEFLATLAHELRNPLAPIRNGLELIKQTDNVPDAVKEVRQIMERQTLQLIRMVNDLLDVARISHGKLVVHLQQAMVEEILQDAVESCRHLLDENDLALQIDIANPGLTVSADPGRMSQVVSNLLHNAIKFSLPGNSIVLSAYQRESWICISLKDQGAGIPPELHSEVFNMFTQGTVGDSNGTRGLGIGLAIVKSIVDLHGGQVRVISDGSNTGSEFVVELPATASALIRRCDSSSPTELEKHRTARLRLLVIDDNESAGRTLAMLLEIYGHETRMGTSGEECLRVAADFLPHVILLDIGMPVMDGLETAREIRRTNWGRQVFLIAVTGWGTEKDRELSKAAGFDLHLTKPIDPHELDQILKERIELGVWGQAKS